MIISKRIFVTFLFFTAGFVGLLSISGSQLNNLFSTPKHEISNIKRIKIGENELTVEILSDDLEAGSMEAIQKGLGERDEIGSDGMLFSFSTLQNPYFWMKDMRFDIDIIWISGDEVVQIDKNVIHMPGVEDKDLLIYQTSTPINMVLEIDAGFSEKYGISVGDKLTLLE